VSEYPTLVGRGAPARLATLLEISVPARLTDRVESLLKAVATDGGAPALCARNQDLRVMLLETALPAVVSGDFGSSSLLPKVGVVYVVMITMAFGTRRHNAC